MFERNARQERAGREIRITMVADLDIAFVDLEMPRLDGVQLLEQLRARGLSIPVILLSGREPEVLQCTEGLATEMGVRVLAVRWRNVLVGGAVAVVFALVIALFWSRRLGAPIARLGFPMAPDELAGVVRVAGLATAAEILLEARLLDAPTARQRGLVHRVVADEQVADEAAATAQRIAAGAPLAARLNKRTLRLVAAQFSFTEDQRAALATYASGPDHREGISAFIEKRTPRFTGA